MFLLMKLINYLVVKVNSIKQRGLLYGRANLKGNMSSGQGESVLEDSPYITGIKLA